jgi:hypothetical protein
VTTPHSTIEGGHEWRKPKEEDLCVYEGAQKEILNEEVGGWERDQRMGNEMDAGAEVEMHEPVEEVHSVVRKNGPKVSGREFHFRLTERDLDLLEFLLDQKFASLEQIYFRFFDARQSSTEPLPNNLFVTRQRLQILRRADLIKTEKVFSEAKSLYLLTYTGYQILQSKRPEAAYAMPAKSMDFRSYEHDTRVNDCRIAIEKTGKVMAWLSERKIRMKGFSSQFAYDKLPKEIVPDGIFVSSKGERIAFEIECTHRQKRRFEEKKQSYLSVMGGREALIQRVFWVGFNERIFGDLKSVAGREKQFFIETYAHFQAKLWPKGRPEKTSL